MVSVEVIRGNYNKVLNDIDKYAKGQEVKVVAASKYVDHQGILALAEAGIEICGENRVQALRDKRDELGKISKENIVEWHFIGNLQKNKIKYIIDYISLVQAVHNLSLLKELDKRAGKAGRKLGVLLEVNVSGEESKHGFTTQEILEKAEEIKGLENIEVKGLMTMAPFTEDESVIRGVFRGLKEFKDELNKGYFENSLTELSMGMSNDYRIALEEGATIIRIGSKLFDDRR